MRKFLLALALVTSTLQTACAVDDVSADTAALDSVEMDVDGNRLLEIKNNSKVSVTIKYKDADGVEQEVVIPSGRSGDVKNFGGGAIDFTPADSVTPTRKDSDTKTTVTFDDKSSDGSDGHLPVADAMHGE